MGIKILLLEDDDGIGTGLKYALESEGYSVEWVKTIGEAKRKIFDDGIGLYVLDLTLPDGSGYEVCREVKSRREAPVIFLTAYDDEVNVVMGLELGADDYISKPFRLKELQARIKTILRRYQKTVSEENIEVGDIRVNMKEARVTKEGREVLLTAMEYRLLLVFLLHRGVVLSRNQLLEQLWDVEGDFVNENTLTVYIKRLRSKLEKDAAQPEYIRTVRGVGYVFGRE